MIRKHLIWIAALMALTAIAGCGGKKAVESTPPPVEPANTKPVVEEPTDMTPTTPTDMSPKSLSDVYFDFDSYTLSSEAKGTLEANARDMKSSPAGTVTIEGHCDERGTKAYNLALGEKRANAAKDYLVALGVNASRVNTVSYGKERPFADGHSESSWAKNRRAHFVVSK